MAKYEVVETMVYEVEADSEEEAVTIITEDENRDARGPACVERYAVLQEDETMYQQQERYAALGGDID